ncbi:MAG: site-specific DNA-methyltransferase [Muribaculaceae bacterium]|nr:site-specific DNA-methyltransferase [Muribaculaceae bacterium]
MDGIAQCISLDENESATEIPVDELVAFSNHNEVESTSTYKISDLIPYADFGDPIYPYLEPIDKLQNAPDSELWHEIIEADNYHALQLLAYLYPGKVDCIYIDPPYNTGARDWKYNNDYVDSNDSYRHSKWLSMMRKRLLLAKKLLNPQDSVLIVTIDEKEYNHLGCLLEELFPEAGVQMVSTVINSAGVTRDADFSRSNEFIYFIKFGTSSPCALPLDDSWRGNTKTKKKKALVWNQLMRSGTGARRIDRENMFYPLYVNLEGDKIVEIGESIPIDQDRFSLPDKPGLKTIWPIRSNGEEGRWRVGSETLKNLRDKGYIRLGRFTENGMAITYLSEGEQQKIENGIFEIIGYRKDGSIIEGDMNFKRLFIPGSQWDQPSHNATYQGSQLLNKFVGNRFQFPKSLYAVHDALRFFVANKPNALIVDFFAGSGTTLHAVNLLNKEDGGQRRCIMVTNNEVSESEEQALKERGLTPADEEWKSLGIARYVAWPRTVASVTGIDVDGNTIAGEYLTYLEEEKEITRKFKKISYAKEFSLLTLPERKDLISELSDGKIAKNKVTAETLYIVDEDIDISILLDDSAVEDWLEELESADHIHTFYIITQNNRLFYAAKARIVEMLGGYKISESKTFPMAEGFKANVEFFHLGFLEKNAVARNKQFREILPLLWLKSGGIGECPEIEGNRIPQYIIFPKNKFAVLIEEYAFGPFEEAVHNIDGIDTIYIVTNSTPGYNEMIKVLNPKNSFQLYRDYLDNFRINHIQ